MGSMHYIDFHNELWREIAPTVGLGSGHSFAINGVETRNVMETLEFIIYPDGRVKETVTGIVGASCAEVTAAIEAQLGTVVAQQKTSEFFAQRQAQTAAETVVAQASYSQW